MKLFPIILSVFLLIGIYACQTSNTLSLINADNLDNWDIFVPSEDVNPEDVFQVEDGVINVSGIPNGYIRTKDSYSNFKLHVEWRWMEEPKNSGVLIHVQGENIVWPHCIECQLKNENAGDFVLMRPGAGITINDSVYAIDPEGKKYLSIPKFEESSENPAGEWNSYDIVSKDGNIEVRVNEVLQNSGSEMTLTEGNIALQSEGGPMQFRNIKLTPQ
jgi:hypothetical protein